MKIETAVREFKYGSMTLADPDPSQTPEEVKAFYAGIYPELNNAEIETERKGAKTVYEFRKAVGTKGGHRHQVDPGKEKAARAITDRNGLTDPRDPHRLPITDSRDRVKSSDDDETACRIGVGQLASAMLAKLARKRKQEDRSGWNDPDWCNANDLADMLIEHLKKGDPVDIANFAMMLHNRPDARDALARAYRRHVQLIGLELRDDILVPLKSAMTKVVNKACRARR